MSLLALLACTPEEEGPAARPSPVTVELGAIPTVATVRWTTDAPTAASVRFDGGETAARPASTDHEVVVVGMRPDTTYSLQALDDGAPHGEPVELTTGALDRELPGLGVDTPLQVPIVGLLACQITVGATPSSSVVLVDGEGQVLWGFTEPEMLVFYAGLLPDDRGVWALASSFGDGPPSYVVELSWAGERSVIAAPGLHHDLRPLPEGGYLGTRSVMDELDGRPVVGDEVVALAPDGGVTTWWSAFEDLPRSGPWEGSSDWTHANGIDIADDGRIALSLFGTHQVVLLDASGATGHVLGFDGDVVADEGFGPQHAPRFTADGLWIFDNGATPDVSRALRFVLDGASATAAEILPLPDGGRTDFLGDVRLLSTGEAVIAAGYHGRVFVLDGAEERGSFTSDRVLGGVVPLEAWP